MSVQEKSSDTLNINGNKLVQLNPRPFEQSTDISLKKLHSFNNLCLDLIFVSLDLDLVLTFLSLDLHVDLFFFYILQV